MLNGNAQMRRKIKARPNPPPPPTHTQQNKLARMETALRHIFFAFNFFYVLSSLTIIKLALTSFSPNSYGLIFIFNVFWYNKLFTTIKCKPKFSIDALR